MRKAIAYGTGRIFKPTYRRNGKTKTTKSYWVAYYRDGRELRESTKTSVYAEAVVFLKAKITGTEPPKTEPLKPTAALTITDLIGLIEADYALEGRTSIVTLRRSRFPHLKTYFKEGEDAIDVSALDPAAIQLYRDHRKRQKAANGSINREVAVLVRGLRLAYDRKLVTAHPSIKKLKEAAPRSGFFEWDQFQLVLAKVDPWWHELYTVAYVTGWRVDAELCPLTWTQVSFMNGNLSLDPGTTKNGDGRNFPFTPRLEAALKAQRIKVNELQRKKDRVIKWVFPRQRTAIALTSAYKPLKKAAKDAGMAEHMPHDFRRTAVRNLENAGVPRQTAKRMVGHKTDSMYERYNIVDQRSLDAGREKLAAYEAKEVAFAAAALAEVEADKLRLVSSR